MRMARTVIFLAAAICLVAEYGEIMSIILSGLRGLLVAFIAYGRLVLKPIL